jgi:hypothetical protein
MDNNKISDLPIVTFGKYKDKLITELLADQEYVKWLKQQSWFPKQKSIYNIIVNQQITSQNINQKTPEHNKLQNMFLDNANKQKLIDYIFPTCSIMNKLYELFNNEEFIFFFGKKDINNYNIINSIKDDKITFETIFNWDLCIEHKDYLSIEIQTIEQNELSEKNKFKKIFDAEQIKKFNDKINEFDDKINIRKEYDEIMLKKYEEELNYYIENKEQNNKQYEKEQVDYKTKEKLYDDNKTQFEQKILLDLCKKFKLSIDEYKKASDYSNEKKAINKEFIKYITQFESENKPKYDKMIDLIRCPEPYDERENFWHGHHNCDKYKKKYNDDFKSVYSLNYNKDNCIDEYKNKYNKRFEEEYDLYKKEIYKKLFKNFNHTIKKNNDIYIINIDLFYNVYDIFFEIKPILSDDYPNVLRKMKMQKELTQKNKIKYNYRGKELYYLLIDNFISDITTKKQLKDIFNQSNIRIIFIKDILNNIKNILNNKNTLNEINILQNDINELNNIITNKEKQILFLYDKIFKE